MIYEFNLEKIDFGHFENFFIEDFTQCATQRNFFRFACDVVFHIQYWAILFCAVVQAGSYFRVCGDQESLKCNRTKERLMMHCFLSFIQGGSACVLSY